VPAPPRWSALPRFERGGLALFAAAAATTALLGDHRLGASLLLDPARTFAAGEAWRVLSAPFVFPEGRAGGLLLTLGVQWFLGGPVERSLGTRRYLAWTLGAAVFGYAILAALGLAGLVPPGPARFGGMLPADLAVATTFGLRLAHVRLSWMGVLPVGARTLAGAVVGLALASEALSGAPLVGLVPPVVAVAVAFARFGPRPPFSRRAGRRRRANHLRVVPPDDVTLH